MNNEQIKDIVVALIENKYFTGNREGDNEALAKEVAKITNILKKETE